MVQTLDCVALVVPTYDEAIAYYTQVLSFDLIEDTPLPKGQRWVLVAPPGARGVQFLETPREESYATVVVFQDTFGNRWDLLQPKVSAAS